MVKCLYRNVHVHVCVDYVTGNSLTHSPALPQLWLMIIDVAKHVNMRHLLLPLILLHLLLHLFFLLLLIFVTQFQRRNIWYWSTYHHPPIVACDTYCERSVHKQPVWPDWSLSLSLSAGAVLSAKTRSDKQLQNARAKARRVIHALHKSQDKNKEYTVSHTHIIWDNHYW